MGNMIEGLDKTGRTIWTSQKTAEGWLGTTEEFMLVWHTTAAVALEFYLTMRPDTDMVRALVNGSPYSTVPAQLKAKSIMDLAVAELNLNAAG